MPCLGTIKQFVSPKIEQKKRGEDVVVSRVVVGHSSDPIHNYPYIITYIPVLSKGEIY